MLCTLGACLPESEPPSTTETAGSQAAAPESQETPPIGVPPPPDVPPKHDFEIRRHDLSVLSDAEADEILSGSMKVLGNTWFDSWSMY